MGGPLPNQPSAGNARGIDVFAVVSCIAAVVAAVPVLVGLEAWFETTRAKAAGLAVIVGVLLLVLTVGPWLRRRAAQGLPVGLRTGLLILFTVAATVAITVDDPSKSGQPPKPTTTTTPSTTVPPAPIIEFDQPAGELPPCPTLTGTGRIPEGQQLRIFIRTAPDAYYWAKDARQVDSRWSVQLEVGSLGAPGSSRRIYAVLVDPDLVT